MLRILRNRRTGFAQALAAFALLAMAFRALLPAGYMLAPSPDGGVTAVAFCIEHHAIEPVFDAGGGKSNIDERDDVGQPEDKPHHAAAPCVFSAIAAVQTPDHDLSVPIGLIKDRSVEPARVHFADVQGLAAPPPWATGPPSRL